MPKLSNLATALQGGAAAQDVGAVLPSSAPPEVQLEGGGSARAPSRSGLRAVTCYVKPEAHKQLRMLGLETGTSVQDLMTEALNDLFSKHGRSIIA